MRNSGPAQIALAMLISATAVSAAEPAQAAQRSELLVSSILADPSIVAPVVDWRVRYADGSAHRLGLSGWTLGAEWTGRRKGIYSLIASAEATPIHAHNSNRIFISGERARYLEYGNAAYRLRAGVRSQFSEHSTTDVQAAVLYESVSDLQRCQPLHIAENRALRTASSMCAELSTLEERWRRPYTGIDITHTWSRTTGGNPLVGSIEGIEVTARAEVLAGRRSWSRISVVEAGGHDVGPWHFSHGASILNGSRLDRVNRFLLGGSWDALGGTAVYGFRYGEFRVRRATTASGGLDRRLPGTWRAGLRISCSDSDVARVCGTAINASMTWNTIGVVAGVGKPVNRSAAESPAVIYVAAVVPLRQR